jgi:hypothetical protein
VRLATDQIACELAVALEAAGHQIMLRRARQEPAEAFLARVRASDADAVVSQARWFGRHAWRDGMFYVRVPGNARAAEHAEAVLANLARCR